MKRISTVSKLGGFLIDMYKDAGGRLEIVDITKDEQQVPTNDGYGTSSSGTGSYTYQLLAFVHDREAVVFTTSADSILEYIIINHL